MERQRRGMGGGAGNRATQPAAWSDARGPGRAPQQGGPPARGPLWQERVLVATGSGVVVTDPVRPDNPVVYCNPAFERITGYARAEALGRNCRFLQGPDTDPDTVAAIRTCVAERRECQVTLLNYRQDGTPFWNDLTVSPVTDAAERLLYFVSVQNDVTARVRAEEALRENEGRTRSFLREVLLGVSEGRLRLCDAEADLPRPLAVCGPPLSLRHESLREIRHQTVDAAQARGLSLERRQDLVTAVGEAATNAVVHGGGGESKVCAVEACKGGNGGTVQVWIIDHGAGIAFERLHRATLERGYTTAGSLGHGFWIMLRTVDRLWLLTGPSGTTVVLEQDHDPPLPSWLREAKGVRPDPAEAVRGTS